MELSPTTQALVQFLPLFTILILLPFVLWMTVRILSKAGYSGAWSLLTLIPIVNIVMIWVFAFSAWPALRTRN